MRDDDPSDRTKRWPTSRRLGPKAFVVEPWKGGSPPGSAATRIVPVEA
jgi:hypothetical protein